MNKEGINPTTFTLTAVIVGMLATDDLSYPELNALGNWLVLLGDYLLTYAAQEYVIDNNIQKQNYFNEKNINDRQIEYLYNAINKMQIEIEKIKKETHQSFFKISFEATIPVAAAVTILPALPAPSPIK